MSRKKDIVSVTRELAIYVGAQSLRALASRERHQCGDLSGDVVRRLSERRQGLVPGRFGRTADAREERSMVFDW